jgi:hypothetical protein
LSDKRFASLHGQHDRKTPRHGRMTGLF